MIVEELFSLRRTSTPGIGDILKSLVPFLSLYREYMENVHTSISLVDTWRQKSQAFSTIVDEIEVDLFLCITKIPFKFHDYF